MSMKFAYPELGEKNKRLFSRRGPYRETKAEIERARLWHERDFINKQRISTLRTSQEVPSLWQK